MSQKRHDKAVTLVRRRYHPAPHPDLYVLATTLELAGDAREAEELFFRFERAVLERLEPPATAP